MTQYVYGKNVVRQILSSEKKIYEVLMLEQSNDLQLKKDIENAGLKITSLSRKKMDALFPGAQHQGIAVKIDEYKTYSIEEIIASIPKDKMPLFVMLDGLEDPHNLGAILRTCDAVGVDGVIIGKHRSVSLTSTVAKVSTGAIDTIKVAMVTNLAQTLQQLKKAGYWVAAADLQDSIDYRKGRYDSPLVLVIGSEGFGISPLVKKNCDFTIALPMEGTITSLNASVACGIILYEIYNQRHKL
ncbi:MAG: 23S rRNA (guanosine(2251)-2'-O)-methyltransferase RlmB [Erysipelotrichaceae bacterium]